MSTLDSLADALLDLYGGRRDVAARGYESARGHGWMPACAAQWDADRCGLVGSRWRCGECEHHRPVALTRELMLMHLVGEGAVAPRDSRLSAVWLGAYLVDEAGLAKVGIYDIDNHAGAGQPHAYLEQLRDGLADRDLLDGIAIFRSRRGRGPEGGYHVVLSLAEPQPESWVRNVLAALARNMELLPPPPPKLDGLSQDDRVREQERWLGEHGAVAGEFHSRFGDLDVEIFPKLASPDSPYGFLIALPAGGHWEQRTGGGIAIERDTLAEVERDYTDYLAEVVPLTTERFMALAQELGVELVPPDAGATSCAKTATRSKKSRGTKLPLAGTVTLIERTSLEPLFEGCTMMRVWRDRQVAGPALSRNEWWPGAVLLWRGCGSAGRELVIELDQTLYGDGSKAEEQIEGWRASGLPTCRGAFRCAEECFADEGASPVRHLLSRPVADQTHEPVVKAHVSAKDASSFLLEEIYDLLAHPPQDEVAVIAAEAGSGKTTAMQDALHIRAMQNKPIVNGRVLPLVAGKRPQDHRAIVMTPTHDLAAEWVERGRQAGLEIERLPQLTEEMCVAGKYEEIEAVAEAGHDRRAAVCERCPHYPEAEPETRCPYYVEFARVAESSCDVLVAVRAYHRHMDYYGSFANETRPSIVYDEDVLPDVLYRVPATTSGQLRAFADALAALIPAEAHPVTTSLALALRRSASSMADLLDDVQGTRALTLEDLTRISGGLTPVAEALDTQHVEELTTLLGRAWADGVARTQNHLPLLLELARACVGGHQPIALVSRRTIRAIVRYPLPGPQSEPPRRVVLLDATASREVLERALQRPIALRAEMSLEHDAKLVHYVGRTWSREALKTDTGRERLAKAVTRLIERHPDAKVGIISYRSILQDGGKTAPTPQETDLVRRLPEHVARQVQVVGHFGGLRGINAMEDVDVLVVIGTPRPPEDEIRLTALALGATPDEIAEEGAVLTTAYHGQTLRAWGWRGALMRMAHHYHVGSELAQGVGRLRHARGQGKVLYILSGEPVDLPGLEVRSVIDDGLLEDQVSVDGARRAAVELLDAGGLTQGELEQRLQAPRRQTRRLYADVVLWLGSRVRREGPRRGRLVWATPVATPEGATTSMENLELFA